MKSHKQSNHQMQINDLIDLAVSNAMLRRGLIEEDCIALSDDEATKVAGGATISRELKPLDIKNPKPITVAGFKPICPPLIIGLIIQDDYNTLA